jgi:hypothetical protein
MVLSLSRALVRARSTLSIFVWAPGMARFFSSTDAWEPSSCARAHCASTSAAWAVLSWVRAALRAGLSMSAVSAP